MKVKNIFVLVLVVLISMSFVSAGFFDWFRSTGYVVDDEGWTAWLDRDGPGGSGDWETFGDFRKAGKVCENPKDILCETTSGKSIAETGENVVCELNKGAICINADQPDGRCNYDYRVRFFCEAPVSEEEVKAALVISEDEIPVKDPKDMKGNGILISNYYYKGDYRQYAGTYCQMIEGCTGFRNVVSVDDNVKACRCDDYWGCEGGSCVNSVGAHSAWERVGSVICTGCANKIEETVEEPVVEIVEEPVIEASGEPVVEVAQEPAVEAVEDTVASSEEPVEETLNDTPEVTLKSGDTSTLIVAPNETEPEDEEVIVPEDTTGYEATEDILRSSEEEEQEVIVVSDEDIRSSGDKASAEINKAGGKLGFFRCVFAKDRVWNFKLKRCMHNVNDRSEPREFDEYFFDKEIREQAEDEVDYSYGGG